MKTHEVIKIKESELVARLKEMQLEELEMHAQSIMKDMGSDNYGGIMGIVMKAIKDDTAPNTSQFELVQNTIRENLPNEAYMSDIYARLAAIVMTIISRKFKQLYGQN